MTLFSKQSILPYKLTQHKTPIPLKILTAFSLCIASLYAPLLHAAPIYKVIDAQTGQVTFTDSPQKYEQQADKQVSQLSITTGNSSANNANTNPNYPSSSNSPSSSTSTNNAASEPAASKPVTNYQLTITEPSEERAYHRPAQSIEIMLQLKPALQAGDKVSIYLDDKEVAQGLSASIATVDMLPGEHRIQAVVTGQDGKTLQQVSRTVYVIQNNQILKNKKKLAAQMLAYQRLPWHQKMLLKMRQKDPNQPSAKPAS